VLEYFQTDGLTTETLMRCGAHIKQHVHARTAPGGEHAYTSMRPGAEFGGENTTTERHANRDPYSTQITSQREALGKIGDARPLQWQRWQRSRRRSGVRPTLSRRTRLNRRVGRRGVQGCMVLAS